MQWLLNLPLAMLPLLWTKHAEAGAVKRPLLPSSRKPVSRAYSSMPVMPPIRLKSSSNDALEDCSCPENDHADDKSPAPLLDRQSPAWMVQAVCSGKQRQSGTDIYRGLMALMIRVEDALRSSSCAAFAVHKQPVIPSGLLADYLRKPDAQLALGEDEERLLKSARQCRLDYKLLHKTVRLAMQRLVNEATCARFNQSRKDAARCHHYYAVLNRRLLPGMPSLGPWNNGAFWDSSLYGDQWWFNKNTWPRLPPTSGDRYTLRDRADPWRWRSNNSASNDAWPTSSGSNTGWRRRFANRWLPKDANPWFPNGANPWRNGYMQPRRRRRCAAQPALPPPPPPYNGTPPLL